MESVGKLKIVLKDCPIHPIENKQLKAMLAKALMAETNAPGDTVSKTGPELIASLLEANEEHASSIIWTLMNLGMNIMMMKSATAITPKKEIQ